MKVFAVLFLSLLAVAAATDDLHCYKDISDSCGLKGSNLEKCNSQYSAFSHTDQSLVKDIRKFMCDYVALSYKYLMTATNFNSYRKDREGFYKLFRKMSDHSWEKAIELIKYLAKRGSEISPCNNHATVDTVRVSQELQGTEYGAMARALDWEKKMAEEAQRIHGLASRKTEAYHDPEVSSYIEEHFVHQHAKVIRELAGHLSDLNTFMKSNDKSLGIFIFDEYLKKMD